MIQQTYHTDGWSRVYRTVFALVVEAHVTTGYRGIELDTSIAHTFQGMYELIVHLWIVRVTEVQTVGNS
ncbi:hypothetical protein D3C80_2035340 [compost metagenome]